jgi:hypothetical protein
MDLKVSCRCLISFFFFLQGDIRNMIDMYSSFIDPVYFEDYHFLGNIFKVNFM